MNTSKLSVVWLKASVLGTVWAAMEIILGSFLHNLHIPLRGSLLTALAVVLLIAASYRWQNKGLFWRSGLVCALMKALSPSAVIFGPMIAIFMEALMFEAGVRTFGRNTAGYIAGAILAMSWTFFQKIANLLIYYGANIIEIYKGLLSYVSKQLGIQSELFWEPVLLLATLYISLGIASAFAGMYIGRKARNISVPLPGAQKEYTQPASPASIPQVKYSVAWLVLSVLALIATLTGISISPVYIWIPFTLTVIILWAWRYKRAMRQLLKPRFWTSFIIISLLAAIVVSYLGNSTDALRDGILTGLEMNFRAAIVIMGFSVIGTELYNPAFRKFFSGSRFSNAASALKIAFESLPMVISTIPDTRFFLSNPHTVIGKLLLMAEKRFIEISHLTGRITMITGEVGSGKTTRIKALSEEYKSKGLNCGGFYSPRILEDGITTGYDLVSIETGVRHPFLRLAKEGSRPDIGRYVIQDGAIAIGEKLLDPKHLKGISVVFIDEIGKLEYSGRGWMNAFQKLLDHPEIELVITSRNSPLDSAPQPGDRN